MSANKRKDVVVIEKKEEKALSKKKQKTTSDALTATTFMYFSKSKDVAPGTGASEYITKEDQQSNKYDNLKAIPDWRKSLSNFYSRPLVTGSNHQALFKLDGKEWYSVEHYFQGSKFKDIAPTYYASFTMDSSKPLSVSSGEVAKKAGGKKGHPLTQQQRGTWEKTKHEFMENALFAKYSQNEDLKQLLLLTKDAVLTHRPSRSPRAIIEHELMRVRTKLQQE